MNEHGVFMIEVNDTENINYCNFTETGHICLLVRSPNKAGTSAMISLSMESCDKLIELIREAKALYPN